MLDQIAAQDFSARFGLNGGLSAAKEVVGRRSAQSDGADNGGDFYAGIACAIGEKAHGKLKKVKRK